MVMRSLASIFVVIFALIVVWYLSAFVLNTPWAIDKAKRAGIEISSKELVLDTWSQEKPKLPAPHQVGLEISQLDHLILYFSWVLNRNIFGNTVSNRDCS
jgi:hypothetical protein